MKEGYLRLLQMLLTFLLISTLGGRAVAQVQTLSTIDLAERSLRKGMSTVNLGSYMGILLVHGMAELADIKKSDVFTTETESILLKYSTGGIDASKGNFISYEAGGTAAAYMGYKNLSTRLAKQVRENARRMMLYQPRSSEDLMVVKTAKKGEDRVFIDIAFAVAPYLLYAGLANNNQQYIDYSVYMTMKFFEILRDKSNGLLHQGRGFQGKGVISEDNWSRGNGWGAMSLATLVRDLPDAHPQKAAVNKLAKEYFTTVLKFQDKQGMFHQEMTEPKSFVETSGTALLLYSLGIAIEKGILPEKFKRNIILGLRGLTSYINQDGSINNSCTGCLCPRDGKKDDYINYAYLYNEPHSFGAAILAMVQGYRLGIKEITPLSQLGIYAQQVPYEKVKPQTVFRFLTRYKRTIAWENDKIAFRTFDIATRLGSGIDIFAKKVSYPIIDKFYELNNKGISYHEDHGEGLDFYDAGTSRGCGGLAIIKNGNVYTSAAYYRHKVLKNSEKEIEFELIFKPFKAGDKEYTERKKIRMKMGTQFFEVTSVIDGDPGDIVVGIGLTTFGEIDLRRMDKEAALMLWDRINTNPYALGTGIIADKSKFAGFTHLGSDEYILMKVKAGKPFTYRVGAAWEGADEIKTADQWYGLVRRQLMLAY